MKTKTFLQIFFLATAFALAFFAVDQQIAHAQSGCTDAAGAPVECPPTDDGTSSDTGGDSSSTNNPTNTPEPPRATFTPVPTATLFVPTATPITITNPVDDPGVDGNGWSGTCSGTPKETTRCIGVFTNACEHVGGSADGDVQTDGSVKMTCTVPATADPSPSESTDPMPTSEPPGSSTGENDGSPAAGCGNDPKNPDLVIDCALKLTNKCLKAGGSSSQTPQEDGSILVFCSKWIFDEPLPEDENELDRQLDGDDAADGETGFKKVSCAKNTNVETNHHIDCAMRLTGKCVSNGGSSTSSADKYGNIVVTCSKDVLDEPLPEDENVLGVPLPEDKATQKEWLLYLPAIAAVVAIPAFLRYRKQRKLDQLKNKEAVAIYTSTGDQPKPERTPTREHILLNKEDDGAASGDFNASGVFDAPDLASDSGRDVIVSRDDKDKE